MKYSSAALIVVIVTVCISCATAPAKGPLTESPEAVASYPEGNKYRSSEMLSLPLNPEEQRLMASADSLMGRAPGSKVVIDGRTFTLDCIGTVCAVYYPLKMDLTRDFSKYPGNGVKRLFASLSDRNVMHRDHYPRPGDIVFWDNTWDANEDGNKNNDPLTHAGVVVKVEEDGTIHYVHSHIRRGIIVEVMNLKKPDKYYDENGKVINNALAMGSGISKKVNPEHWLSGDLCNSLADALSSGEYYRVASSEPGDSMVLISRAESLE